MASPQPFRGRAAQAPHRSSPYRRYELVERLGGVCRESSRTRSAYLEHEQAKAELKSLVPEDAQQAIGHGSGQALQIGRHQLRPLSAEGSAMQRSSPRSAPWLQLSPRPRANGRPGEVLVATILGWTRAEPNRPSAMRPSRAGSTSSARSWASMRSRPCRPPPSIRRPGSSISQRSRACVGRVDRLRLAGVRRSARPRPRVGWELR